MIRWIWRTRDGTKIPVHEMTDQHLFNTIRFLRRRGYCTPAEFDTAYSALGSLSPDSMAAYYATSEVFSMKPIDILVALEEEFAIRRAKTVKPEQPPGLEYETEAEKELDQFYELDGWGHG